MMRSLGLAALVTVALSTGCATVQGEFRPNAFVSGERTYFIDYASASTRELLPPPWKVANFTYEGALPERERVKGSYASELQWELQSGETLRSTTTTYELLFQHSTNAAIWVRLLPIPHSLRNRQARYAVEDYVNGFSGSVVSDWLGTNGIARRVATKIIESKPIVVDGFAGHEVTFEIANLDQLQLDPNAPRTRARVIFISAGLRKRIHHRHGESNVASYLVLGYQNDAPAFDSESAALDTLLQRVHIKPIE